MASTSSSSSPAPRWTYDVFLSFRGEDNRKSFVDHLYAALDQKGIFTFKDDVRLERGKSISPELLKAIEESRFAIIVFSKNYASSSWCLDELAKIVEWSKLMGQTVLPVFYDVEPSDVRKQTGDFGKVIAKHESEDVERRWRKALVEAANLSGWVLKNTANGHESKFIQQIVKDIWSKLQGDTVSSDGENLVGIESHVEKVNSLLGIGGSNDVGIVGIWGLGGIGKTTIARAIFDRISNQFEGASFLHEVRQASEKHGLPHLQEILLCQILKVKNLKINNVYDGKNMIRTRLCYKRVLLVFDDVDNLEQLEMLAGKHDWFGLGSRIIITTRDKGLFVGHDVKIHEMSLLNDDEAIRLFSWKAFKADYPRKDFEELSRRIVQYAGGLPLALKVLGSSLCGKDMTTWRSALDKLVKEGPDGDIRNKLQIGFDGLGNSYKEIFLDIVCFFKGEDKHSATRILDCFGFSSEWCISVLIEKSLISLSYDRLEMHQLIQEMGWHMVRQNSPQQPGTHSRLWLTHDIKHVLTTSTGTEKVERIWLQLSKSKDINIRSDAFTKMKRLRLLILDNVCVPRGPDYLPNALQWLNWHGFPSKSMPPTFEAEMLVGLKLHYSRIVQLWKGQKVLDKLKYIDLSHSQKLIRIPDFTAAPNLEELILESCTSLVEVHSSVGLLKRLVLIYLKDCRSLRRLPNSIQSESLETFNLSGCLKLEKFPEILVNMEHLFELNLEKTCIKELPSSIERLTSLVWINLSNCKNLRSLPSTICKLTSLKELVLSGCSKLDKLPEEMGCLECLKALRFEETAIRELPSSIEHLTSLVRINLSNCKNLSSLPSTICKLTSLKGLDLSGCSKLDKLPEEMGNLECLVHLDVGGTAITQPPSSIALLKNLNFLSFSGCKGTASQFWFLPGKHQGSMCLVLPSLSGLCSLTSLDLSYCNLLEIPSDLGCLSLLEVLNLEGNRFVNIPAASISKLSRLLFLSLVGCEKLEALPELPSTVCVLYVDDCASLRSFPDQLLTEGINHPKTISFIKCLRLFEDPQACRHLLQRLSVIHSLSFRIYYPGRDIPEWFSHQNVGPSISVKLPPVQDSNKCKWVGIVFCVIFASIAAIPRSFPGITNSAAVQLSKPAAAVQFKVNGKLCCTSSLFIGTVKIVDSENVCLGYQSFIISECDDSEIEVSVSGYKDKTVVKKLGIRLAYQGYDDDGDDDDDELKEDLADDDVQPNTEPSGGEGSSGEEKGKEKVHVSGSVILSGVTGSVLCLLLVLARLLRSQDKF